MFNLGYSKMEGGYDMNATDIPKVITYVDNDGSIRAMNENFVGVNNGEHDIMSSEYPQRMQQDIFHESIKERLDRILNNESIVHSSDSMSRKIFIGSITVVGLFMVFKSLQIVKR